MTINKDALKDAVLVIVLLVVVPALITFGVYKLLDNKCHDITPPSAECSGVCA